VVGTHTIELMLVIKRLQVISVVELVKQVAIEFQLGWSWTDTNSKIRSKNSFSITNIFECNIYSQIELDTIITIVLIVI